MDNLGPSQAFDFYKHGVASGQTGLYTPFLGPPAREQKMNAYEQRSHAKWNMPDAYVGENKTLRDTMEDYMLTAQYDWYTERILPWYKTDDIHFQWTEWENNPHYLGITPHQAASRVVTQKRTIRRASIVRRGIAAEFEHDFVATAIGRTSFMASLAQMARSVQETANVEVIRALLHCHRGQQLYLRKYGIVKDYELDEYHERRANRFMIAQKDEFGLEKLSVEIETEQEVYQARADVWILDRAIFNYTTTVPEGKIFFYKGGQEAVDRINGRRKGAPAAAGTMGNVRSLEPERMVGETPVFIAKSFHVENIGKADLMSRVTEIGVYNTMIDRTTDYFHHSSASRKIRVYDNDIDGWADIEFEYALRHCGIWDDKGELANVYDSKTRGHQAQRDEDYDFLSMPAEGGGKKNIGYVGDISLNYQTEHDMIDAARTMLVAAAYGDRTRAHDMLKDGANRSALVGAVRSIVGRNNIFFGALAAEDAFNANFANINSALAFPAQASMGSRATGSNETLSQMETRFLSDIMGAALPAAYQARVQEIASQSAESWRDRAATIKGMVLEAIERDPQSVTALRSPTDVDTWFQKNVNSFGAKHKERSEVRVEAGQTGEGKYFPVDQPLPTGYRWADPENVHQSVLARMPAFQSFLRARGELGGSGESAPRFGGRARIGARGAGGLSGADRSAEQSEALDRDAENRKPAQTTRFTANVFGNLVTLVERISKSGAHPLLQALAIIYAGTPFNRDVLCNYVKNNIAVKLGLLLMRPHCTYRTKFGIKCLSGGGSGYTFFGHSNMQIEHEAARKVGMMHYTTYLSAVVLYPKNVYVVEDLYCDKYLGGMGVEFWRADRYRSGTQKRTAYDIICAPLPPSRRSVEQKIDVRGRWYTEFQRQLVAQDRFDQPLYESCGRINKLFGWYDASGKDRSAVRSRVPPNYVCWQGMQWHFNAKLGRFDDYIIESGCMGHKVGPGAGLVRNGKLRLLPDFNYHAVH